MSDEKSQASIPAYLMQALEEEQKTGNTDIFAPNYTTPKLRRIEIPQRNSNKWAGAIGKLIINSDENPDQVEEAKHIDFLLVDALYVEPFNAPDWVLANPLLKQRAEREGIGSRTMWEFDEAGKRVTTATRPICSSPNGFTAWPSNIGQEVYDYRTKSKVKIGYKLNEETGHMEAMEHSCIGCPFSEWITTPSGKLSPMCRETYVYVLYDIDRQELLTIKGVNVGVQLALAGQKGTSGRLHNGQPLEGIKRNFSYTGTVDGVSCFRNRPEGKPTLDNPYAPVYPARMTVTLNNFSPATAIPQFTLLDGSVESIPVVVLKNHQIAVSEADSIPTPKRLLDAETYAAYLRATTRYSSEGWREEFMAMSMVDRVREQNQAFNALTSGSDAVAQLPAGSEEALNDPF